MWSISELKRKGKFAFKRNYWKTVIVSLIFVMLGGGFSASSWDSDKDNSFTNNILEGNSTSDYSGDHGFDEYATDEFDFDYYEDDLGFNGNDNPTSIAAIAAAGVIIVFVVAIVGAIVVALILVVDAFIINPFEVGAKRFFVKNLNTEAQVREIGFAFDNCYKNVAKTMFAKDLYTVLWSLLLVIPGIVKAYEYKMIPYLLAEHPDMPEQVAFAESKRLMNGNKWRAFLLDLSFIGWHLLSILTLGILEIFYVSPYLNMTHAALYEAICYTSNNNYDTMYNNNF